MFCWASNTCFFKFRYHFHSSTQGWIRAYHDLVYLSCSKISRRLCHANTHAKPPLPPYPCPHPEKPYTSWWCQSWFMRGQGWWDPRGWSAGQLQLSRRRWHEEVRCAAPWCWDDDARTCISKPKVFIFHRRRYNKWYGNFKLNMIQDQSKTAFFAQTVSLLMHPLRSWEKEPTICMGLGSAFWYDYILNMYVAGELILSSWRWLGSKTVFHLSQIFPTKH